jgi:ABC-type multidrug transport system fused ATPase/permease subunit
MSEINKNNIKTGFRVLLRYLRMYKRETIILSVIGIISAVGNGVVPLIAGKFFDAIVVPSVKALGSFELPLYLYFLILWAVVQVIASFVDWKINIKSENLSNTAWTDYMALGFSHLIELPMSYHKNFKIGTTAEVINRAASSLETIIGRIVIDLAPQFLSIVIAFAVTFWIEPLLGIVLFLGVGLYVVIMYKSVKPLAKIQEEYHGVLFSSWGDAFDAVANTQTIKQATAEEYERKKLNRLWKQNIVTLWNKLNAVWANLTLYQRIIILVTQVVIFLLSVAFIGTGRMTIGELLAFNAYATMMFGPFVTVGRNWQVIQNGLVSIEESEKILNTPKEIYKPHNAAPLNDIKGDLDFKHVHFYYEEDKPVLQDINVKIKSGQIVALVGESGVGKSTFIDLISGYHFPKKGKLLIDGHEAEKIDLTLLRSKIGVVPQEVVLFNDTIRTNLKYGNFNATDEELREAARKAHALDFINKFPDKWEQVVGERGVKLSVGQKQRVAIARAILRNPKILILDEPTSALDAGSEKIITESLEELMHGKTTFIIAHRLSTVRKANTILVFKEGRIIEQGTHDELIKIEGGEYRRLYELQIGLHG